MLGGYYSHNEFFSVENSLVVAYKHYDKHNDRGIAHFSLLNDSNHLRKMVLKVQSPATTPDIL